MGEWYILLKYICSKIRWLLINCTSLPAYLVPDWRNWINKCFGFHPSCHCKEICVWFIIISKPGNLCISNYLKTIDGINGIPLYEITFFSFYVHVFYNSNLFIFEKFAFFISVLKKWTHKWHIYLLLVSLGFMFSLFSLYSWNCSCCGIFLQYWR